MLNIPSTQKVCVLNSIPSPNLQFQAAIDLISRPIILPF